ncbi:uncharacterized protein AKAW2_30780S [Aspergillus luchuensis]|uniref:Uncharacterized protein n=1 Tax=Aspergillus kawachii TaxID=1069201 RepID=A0A7R7ZXU9_ASPKA|nr:uncharacterized protein AKAW2_30780S [Aspergillus luchuensis]BCR97461.1 hypothetical protein AKAW2_30780S [Aspergillus luchuensis]
MAVAGFCSFPDEFTNTTLETVLGATSMSNASNTLLPSDPSRIAHCTPLDSDWDRVTLDPYQPAFGLNRCTFFGVVVPPTNAASRSFHGNRTGLTAGDASVALWAAMEYGDTVLKTYVSEDATVSSVWWPP